MDVTRTRRLGLESSDLERLRERGRVESVQRRQVVPLDGPTLAIVTGGYLRIFRHAAFVRDVSLGLAGIGDVLAPGAAFGDRSAETGAEALCDAELLHVTAEAWRACANDAPEINIKFAAAVARRTMRLQKKLEERSRTSVEGRLASALLELVEDFGVATGVAVRLDVPLSQQDLARLAGTTRETCSAMVAEFSRAGFVRGGRLRGMSVLDIPGLKQLANG